MSRVLRRLLRLLTLAAALAGCAAPEPTLRRPLLDDAYAPDVLVEARRIELKASAGGNRFLTGWWPLRGEGRPRLVAGEDEPARLELVHLAARPRVLALDLAPPVRRPPVRRPPVRRPGDVVAGATVDVRAAGRDLGRFPVADPLRIPLPADLPFGRVLVELVPRGAPLSVLAASSRPSLAAGEVRREGPDLVHGGTAVVDFVRRVQPGERLAGSFKPPSSPSPGQELRILVEDKSGGFETVWSYSTDDGGDPSIDVPLTADGFVRVRLEARGEGPPGSWRDLALVAPERQAADDGAGASVSVEPPELVLVFVLDALRADQVTHLGGLEGVTPTIDRLAREGFSFRAHRSPAPNTLPSTKALFLGEARVDRGGHKLAADGGATLAEIYWDAGYRTGLFSGNVYVSPAYGMDRGFEHVVEEPIREEDTWNDNAARLGQALLDWLGSLGPGERAFAYVHVIHPHNPYAPPPELEERLTRGVDSAIDGSTRTLAAIRQRRREVDEADRERLRRLYAAALAYADAEIARVLEGVEELRGPRRPFVVVTSDHGEELFDHGGLLHGYTLYEEMVRIPLVVWSPGLVEVGESSRSSGTLDLHATLAELVGAEVASEGRSLLAFLSGGGAGDVSELHLAAAASVKGGIYSAQTDRLKLVWAPRTGFDWGLGGGPGRTRSPEYLFDLAEDPGERWNLAGEGGLEAAWLRSRLLAWIASKKADEDREEPGVDEETERRLRALGYVN